MLRTGVVNVVIDGRGVDEHTVLGYFAWTARVEYVVVGRRVVAIVIVILYNYVREVLLLLIVMKMNLKLKEKIFIVERTVEYLRVNRSW